MSCLRILTILIVALQTQDAYSKSCGTHLPDPEPAPEFKVFGGESVKLGTHPWVAGLQQEFGTKIYNVCGGVLVNSEWVVTSAYCIYRMEGSGVDLQRKAHVVLGVNDMKGATKHSVRLHMKEIFVHEGFDLDPFVVNDIALIKLERPIDLESSSTINTVCLPPKRYLWYPDHLCYLAGWGKTSKDGPPNTILREAELPFIEQETCKELYAEHSLRRINDDFFCAGNDEKGGCSGDAGSPFVCQKEGVWHLIGILSGGGGYCHEPNFPTILVRVESYLDWINKITRQFACGTQLKKEEPNSAPQFKVLGGNDATRGAWPWTVQIQEEYKGEMLDRCGGTLIDTEWVLTNANCIELIAGSGTDLLKNLFVALGFQNLDKNEDGSFRLRITKVIVHEKFQTEPYVEHDVALLKLIRPLLEHESEFINPICLPPDKETDYQLNDCFMSGWGSINPTGDKTPILQEAKLKITDQQTCTDFYAEHLTRRITENYFCAEGDGTGHCGGDPGTPFVCKVGDKWHLVGLTSGGGRPCAEPEYPSIFVRIQNYADWIRETIRLNGCGTSTVERPSKENVTKEYRIRGGTNAKSGAWPWAVALQAKISGKTVIFCGGTLIKTDWVVSAAHCFNELKWRINVYQDLFFLIGYTNILKPEEGSIKLRMEKYLMHAEFSRYPMMHDIALVKLKHPVDYTVNKFINTACFPELSVIYRNYECVTIGWGRLDIDGKPPSVLQEVQAPIYDMDSCIKYAIITNRKPRRDYLCSGLGRKGPCKGDSGSPLSCRKDGKWVIVGIASQTKVKCAAPKMPAIFTRVSHYIHWMSYLIGVL